MLLRSAPRRTELRLKTKVRAVCVATLSLPRGPRRRKHLLDKQGQSIEKSLASTILSRNQLPGPVDDREREQVWFRCDYLVHQSNLERET